MRDLMPGEKPCRLDPVAGDRLQFRKVGARWLLGNRSTRLAGEIVETEAGEVLVYAAGELVLSFGENREAAA